MEAAGGEATGARTRRRFGLPRSSWSGVGVSALFTGLLLLYGFQLQPPRPDPFAPGPGGLAWFLTPQTPPEIRNLPERPLALPAAGWAPRALGDGPLAWIGDTGALQVRPEGRFPAFVLWAGGAAGYAAADGWAYIPGGPPFPAVEPWLEGLWEIERLEAHVGWVQSAAFSPDGARVVTASADGTARVWDVSTWVESAQIEGHGGSVNGAAFSPDGTRLVTASADGTARVWDAVTGAEIARLEGHEDSVQSAAFSPDGTQVVTASKDRTARVWSAATGEELVKLRGHGHVVASAAFSPGGTQIVTSSLDHTARVWAAATGVEIAVLEGHGDSVQSAAFSPDGTRVVTGSLDGTARVWATATGEELMQLKGHEDEVSSAAYSPDGAIVVTASWDGTARLWNTATGQQARRLEGHGGWVTDAAFSPDGALVVTASADGSARVWVIGHPPGGRAGVRLAGGRVCVVAERLSWRCSDGGLSPDLLWRLRDHSSATPSPLSLVLSAHDFVEVQMQRQQQVQQRSRDEESQAVDVASLDVLPDLPEGARLHAVGQAPDGALFVLGTEGVLLVSRDPEAPEPTFALLRRAPGETLTGIRFDEGGGWIAGSRPRVRSWLTYYIENILLLPALLRDDRLRSEVFVLHGTDPAAGPWRELRAAPAPWAFVAGPLALLVTALMAVSAARGPVQLREGIAGAPVSDRPIGWADRDALALKPIARALSRFLRNVDTRPPLTLAVTGGWGTGKSSLMNLLREDLERHGGRPVWFNAWHHREETHLLAALLENLRAQAVPPLHSWTGLAFRWRLLLLRLGPLLAPVAVFSLMAIVALSVASWALGPSATELPSRAAAFFGALDPQSETPWITWLEAHLATTAKALGVLGAFGLVLWKTRALPADPARLLAELSAKASVADFRDKLSFRHRFAEAFGEVCEALRTDTRPGLVVIIDDLDRCPPGAVLQVLEAVNYLTDAGPCFVVLGIDKGQIEHAVGLGFKDLVEGLPDHEVRGLEPAAPGEDEVAKRARKRRAYARHYLEKLINIEVPVPALTRDQAIDMLVATAPDPDPEPAWLAPARRSAAWAAEGVKLLSIAGLVGVTLALVSEAIPSPPATQSASVEPTAVAARDDRVTPERPPATAPPTSEGAPTEAAPTEPPFLFDPPPWTGPASKGAPSWLWWAGSAGVLLFGLAFMVLRAAARRMEMERDSPQFADMLRRTLPYVHSANPTPRAVKLFENRMRYLAARLDAEANPRRPDLLDRLFKLWLPDGWFTPKAPAIDEAKLLVLGAEEAAPIDQRSGLHHAIGDLVPELSDEDRAHYARVSGRASMAREAPE